MALALVEDVSLLVPATGLVAAETVDTGEVLEGGLAAAWQRARTAWLQVKGAASPHTSRAYERALADFESYIGEYFHIPLWLVETAHVRGWQEHMAEAGLSQATMALRMVAASTFYAFVIEEVLLIDGVETSIFCDRKGRPRANPFKTGNLAKPAASRYDHSRPLASAKVELMLRRINTETPTGARDYALLLTFLFTGWRANEVLQMTWGDIAPNPDRPGEYTCEWRGKGGKSELAVLPARCYHAILRFLEVTGRDVAQIRRDEYIWRPLNTCGVQNFRHPGPDDENRHICSAQANNILRKRLRRAGVAYAETYHVHSLRHTFANSYMKATGSDVVGLSRRMHHASLSVTQVYLQATQTPADDYSAALAEVFGV